MNGQVRMSLSEKLGAEHVRADAKTLRAFAGDITENPEGKPELVVFPGSAEEVRAVLVEAGRQGVAVYPVMANTNLGGLSIPIRGGIVLNLARMNRVLEVNEQDQYAVIEPGVTWQQISDHLDAHHPDLRFAYPLSPPDSGVVPNCLMDGLANLSLRHGSASRWINALEVVLPSGEVLHTGHWAYGSKTPCTHAPFPGLDGLFWGFQGSTGVVVKLAVQLWPRKKYRRRLFLLADNVQAAFDLVCSLSRQDLVDDLGALSAPTGKMLFGELRPTYRDPAEPELFVYIDYSSNFEQELALKGEIVGAFVDRYREKGAHIDGPLDIQELVRLEPRFSKFASFPTRLDFLLDHPGGGLTWVGTYGPTSRFADGFIQGAEIMERHGLPPVIVARPMQGAHFGVLRWITVFDREDQQDTDKARKVNQELVDMAMELGFFPYKTPQWVWEHCADRLDPVFCRLVRDVRRMLDPKGIMNPGHLEMGLR